MGSNKAIEIIDFLQKAQFRASVTTSQIQKELSNFKYKNTTIKLINLILDGNLPHFEKNEGKSFVSFSNGKDYSINNNLSISGTEKGANSRLKFVIKSFSDSDKNIININNNFIKKFKLEIVISLL